MKPFHFRKFSIYHHNSTMKVGTDAIMLGAWCDVLNASKILDIGTGSGVIALLLASRCDATIDAVEKDESSAIEAKNNFSNSCFSNQLTLIHNDFIEFASITKKKYNLIVSNPPFFSDDLLPDTNSRTIARHTVNLSHHQLLSYVDKLLLEDGKFCVVLPYDSMDKFEKIAGEFKLFPYRKLIIFPKKGAKPNRVNIEFNRKQISSVHLENMIIRNDNNEHTDDYKAAVSEYLMKI